MPTVPFEAVACLVRLSASRVRHFYVAQEWGNKDGVFNLLFFTWTHGHLAQKPAFGIKPKPIEDVPIEQVAQVPGGYGGLRAVPCSQEQICDYGVWRLATVALAKPICLSIPITNASPPSPSPAAP